MSKPASFLGVEIVPSSHGKDGNDEDGSSSNRRVQAQAPEGMEIGVDFPMVCETCLGDSVYVRMIKEKRGAECKISHLPFTLFRWKVGKGGKYKKTIVCYQVAAEKNICQSCLVDMEYGLPVAVRDAFIKAAAGSGHSDVPISSVNQQYYYQKKAAEAKKEASSVPRIKGGKAAPKSKLLQLVRKYEKPYSKPDDAVPLKAAPSAKAALYVRGISSETTSGDIKCISCASWCNLTRSRCIVKSVLYRIWNS